MRSWLIPARRVLEATPEQIVATGASLGGSSYRDPIDGDIGFKRVGRGSREVPYWTFEKAREASVAAYRMNPMATAIIDTHVAFAVGDKGVSWQATNPEVAEVVREFWADPANLLGERQELLLRSQLILGETLLEMMVGGKSGVVRFSPIDPSHIQSVQCRSGNALWPEKVLLPPFVAEGEAREFEIVAVNDDTGLREGEAMFWAPFRTLSTDTRGMPLMSSILDWLDNYDLVLSNLIDRTALMRHLAYSVEVDGSWEEVDAYAARRGGYHVPPSGSIEIHTADIKWNPISAQTGAMEDTVANQAVLTNIASGSGLSKTWLAEPDGANRATSLSMAEPVRRRVGSVQNVWLCQITELTRFAVDRAVAAKRLPEMVDSKDPRTDQSTQIPASQAVIVTGPEITAADSQITAQTLLNLSTGLEKLVAIGALSREAAQVAAQKAWEDFVGVPFNAELGKPDAPIDDVASEVEKATEAKLRLVGKR
jgi:hypothetical protein